MFDKIKNLFNLKLYRNPIDELIDVTGDRNLSIWNGVNYCGECMFRDPQFPYDCGDKGKTPWLQIGFGVYVSGPGDWGGGFSKTSSPMVKILIDKDFVIKDVLRESPYYNGKKPDCRQEKKIASLLRRIRPNDRFQTSNSQLSEWIANIFAVPENRRYAHCAYIAEVLDSSWEREKWLFDNL